MVSSFNRQQFHCGEARVKEALVLYYWTGVWGKDIRSFSPPTAISKWLFPRPGAAEPAPKLPPWAPGPPFFYVGRSGGRRWSPRWWGRSLRPAQWWPASARPRGWGCSWQLPVGAGPSAAKGTTRDRSRGGSQTRHRTSQGGSATWRVPPHRRRVSRAVSQSSAGKRNTVVAVKAPPTGRSTPTKSATKASTAKVRTILRTSLGGSSCRCLVSFEPESLRLWCVFFRLRACLPLFLSLSKIE